MPRMLYSQSQCIREVPGASRSPGLYREPDGATYRLLAGNLGLLGPAGLREISSCLYMSDRMSTRAIGTCLPVCSRYSGSGSCQRTAMLAFIAGSTSTRRLHMQSVTISLQMQKAPAAGSRPFSAALKRRPLRGLHVPISDSQTKAQVARSCIKSGDLPLHAPA